MLLQESVSWFCTFWVVKWLLDLWWGFKILLPALVDAATPVSVSGKHKNISMAGQYWNQTNNVYTAAAELTSLKHFGTGEVTGRCLGGNSTASLIPSHPQPSPCMPCLSAPTFPSYFLRLVAVYLSFWILRVFVSFITTTLITQITENQVCSQ